MIENIKINRNDMLKN